jgi:hypothetical protein
MGGAQPILERNTRNSCKIRDCSYEGKKLLEILDIDRMTILKWGSSDIGCETMDWIRLARDMIQWWALVKTVLNIGFP